MLEQTRVECRTPSPGKASVRIEAWKFEAVRRAILAVLDDHADGVPFTGLAALVGRRLTPDEASRLGSMSWYVTTVKLEMEVRGEVIRASKDARQMLTRIASRE